MSHSGQDFRYGSSQPDYSHLQSPTPSAPPPSNELDRGLNNLTYDQVVAWWNSLEESQRLRMLQEGNKLSPETIARLRGHYKEYIPKDYYPKQILLPDQFGTCDYYLMYYLFDEIAKNDNGFFFNKALRDAFYILPPVYNEREKTLPPPNQAAAEAWWNGLSQEKRTALETRGSEYKPDQIVRIRREYGPYYRVYYVAPRPTLNFYDYYLMTRYSSCFYRNPYFYSDYLFYRDMYVVTELTLRATFQLGGLALRGAGAAVRLVGAGFHGAGQGLSNWGGSILSHSGGGSSSGSSSSSSSGSIDGWHILVAIGVAIGLCVAACSAVVASLYAGIKAAASLDNLRQGRKLARSLLRLGAIAGGAYVGATQGALVGAIVGSIIFGPGVGTTVGVVLGILFGAPITAAVAAVAVKQLTRSVSWFFTGSTNPEKWDAEKTQKKLQEAEGYNRFNMTTAEIRVMFEDLRVKKSRYTSDWDPFKGAIVNTQNKTEKDRYNKFLEGVQSGLDPRKGIRVDAHTRFRWSQENRDLIREDIELPRPASNLRI